MKSKKTKNSIKNPIKNLNKKEECICQRGQAFSKYVTEVKGEGVVDWLDGVLS